MDYIQEAPNLSSIYFTSQVQRYRNLIQRFSNEYQASPDFIARAPGRVNIIGEHIDYSGYAVFPMAIEYDTIMAVRVAEEQEYVTVKSTQKALYPDDSIPLRPRMRDEHTFLNYFVAGYKAGVHKIEGDLKGFQLLIDGNLPVASGLSSSASFTVCAAIATLKANSGPSIDLRQELPDDHPAVQDILAEYKVVTRSVTKSELSEYCAHYERQVGVAQGGMDQAISIYGEKNFAALVEFDPVRANLTKLPEGISFVIANSLAEMPKFIHLERCYNKRVVECRLACTFLNEHLGLDGSLRTLKSIQEHLNRSLSEMTELVQSCMEEIYTIDSLNSKFGQENLIQLLKDIPYFELVITKNTEFFPRQRAVHVFSEAQRVLSFKQLCDENPDPTLLGELMNQSHTSCRDLYDCSSPELDELVRRSLELGAFGARLTGAGWGGCMLAMIPEQKEEEFVTGLMTYYEGKPGVTDQVVFVTKPAKGATVIMYEESLF